LQRWDFEESVLTQYPKRTRLCQNHHLDSTRWDHFVPRDDDIVIATSMKAGTTWTQAIVAHLLHLGGAFPAPVWTLNPWIDFRGVPLDMILEGLEAQDHRRCVKTHLPMESLRFLPQAKYIYVSRDGRDVAMSLWNHWTNYSPQAYGEANDTPGLVGDRFPEPTGDFHDYVKGFFTRGWFDWESDGYPFWSHLHNVQSWWAWRHLPNVLFLHYGDMKKDTAGAIAQIAAFLGIEADGARIDAVVAAVSIEAMRADADNYVPDGGSSWKGGAKTFLHKGVNGRWRDVMTAEELEMYARACDRVLSDDARRWLEFGGAV
jgi:aryl sulfotransferase